MKNIFIETYGCQMNEYDTELIRSILTKADYTFVDDEIAADIVMLNTCAIREHAHRKVYGRIHTIKHNRNGNPVMIGILGCMATNLRTELFEDKGLKIDFIAGPDSYKRLPDLIVAAQENNEKPFDLTLSEYETYSDIFPVPEKGVGAFISVQRGCNNFCTFCVVPYTRGRERSRSPENVVEEVRQLAANKFKQVTLLGQNVNSYNYEGADFADLIEAVSQVEDIKRIRFTSPHPKDFPDKLLDVITHNPKACKHIHLPLQSGNDRVLDLMNRTYTQKEFLALVDKIRAKCPHIAISTDIIVGFSSESDAEFEDTVKVMRDVEFDSAFIFKYSERKHTIAQRNLADDVAENVKTDRIVRLNELQKSITLKKNKAHIGQIQEVLVENKSTGKAIGTYFGRMDCHKTVIFPAGNYTSGDMIQVRITGASPNNLKGELI